MFIACLSPFLRSNQQRIQRFNVLSNELPGFRAMRCHFRLNPQVTSFRLICPLFYDKRNFRELISYIRIVQKRLA